MVSTPLHRVVQHLRKVTLRDGVALTDGQLLGRFVEQGDPGALEALVRRHGPLVLGVCRRILRHHHDAEDAFQATFLVLVRKAATVVPRERVAGWLYGVAYHTALKARATAARRRWWEKQVADLPEPEGRPSESGADLRPLLDQELAHLPEKYRVPILLCDLEGKTRKEAARQLGWPEGTLSSRLARARTLLARRLQRRGLSPSGGLPLVSATVPPSLLATTVKILTLVTAGQARTADVVSARIVTLVKGVLHRMLLTRLQITMAVVLIAGVLGSGTVGLAYRARAGQTAQVPPGAAPADPPRSPRPSPQRQAPSSALVVVTDEERLQGVWKCVSGEEDGKKEEPNATTGTLQLTVEGNRLTALTTGESNQPLPMTFEVDAGTTPKSIELHKGKEVSGVKDLPGIYEIRGDTLTLCVDLKGAKRPKQFSAPRDSGYSLVVFKREPRKVEAPTSSVQQIESLLRELRENPDDQQAALDRVNEIEKAVKDLRAKLQHQQER